jgi:prepilin-type N-terminal cleavage/methylation domain-containing protein
MKDYGAESMELGTGRLQPAGFTLVELLATIAVIVVVASLTLGTLGYVNRKGAEGRAKAEVAALAAAIDNYKLDYGAYPAPADLFKELTAQGQVNTNKVYFEPKGSIAQNMTNGPFLDPWGAAYNYRTNNLRNVGFFDLWSTSGGKTDEMEWIHN